MVAETMEDLQQEIINLLEKMDPVYRRALELVAQDANSFDARQARSVISKLNNFIMKLNDYRPKKNAGFTKFAEMVHPHIVNAEEVLCTLATFVEIALEDDQKKENANKRVSPEVQNPIPILRTMEIEIPMVSWRYRSIRRFQGDIWIECENHRRLGEKFRALQEQIGPKC